MSVFLRCVLAFCVMLPAALARAADMAIVGAKVYPAPGAAAIPDAVPAAMLLAPQPCSPSASG